MGTRYSAAILFVIALVAGGCGDRYAKFMPPDYIKAIKEANGPAEVSGILTRALEVLQEGNDGDIDKKEALIWGLFSVDDLVLSPLRTLGETEETQRGVANAVLFYIGDEVDVRRAQAGQTRTFDPIKKEIIGADLELAIQAVRDTLTLPEGHFTVDSQQSNQSGTKVYVRVTVGPKQPFQCAGWGLMFHEVDGGWKLIWVRDEWVS